MFSLFPPIVVIFSRAAVRVALCATLALLALEKSCSATCSAGILRMKPFPTYDRDNLESGCYAVSAEPDANGVKSLCGVEYKAAVNASGVVRLAPLSTETYQYSYPYPFHGGSGERLEMPCQDMNASGLLKAGSSTFATVTLWDEVGGVWAGLSTLSRTGPHQITLRISNTYFTGKANGVACRYNYTVVSGCFMGIKAPSTPPACPAGYYTATGLADAKYCAPCPPGTSATNPKSKSCTPCPAGTYSSQYGSKCRKCKADTYAAKAGATECYGCNDNEWSTGKKCAKCPAGSYPSPNNPKQCHKCKAGAKCCTVNPSADCPACPKGWTPGPPATSVFALSSGSTPACLASKHALCAPKFSITIRETCLINIVQMPPAAPQQVSCRWSATATMKGRSANLKADLFILDDRSFAWDYNALVDGNVTKVSAPYVDFTFAPATTFDTSPKCTLRYRALSASAAQLGAASKPCPKGKPGCASLAGTCPAGQYLETQTDTKPAPCLPCPPGTYNDAPSTKSCKPCPLGKFAAGYGNKACKICPPTAPITPNKGAIACKPCHGSVLVGFNKCKPCRRFSAKPSSGADVCLSNQFGSVCCALGKCNGTPACPSKLQAPGSDAGAVLQLVSRHLPQPLCKSATLLTCMGSNASALLSFPMNDGITFRLDPILQPRCVYSNSYGMYPLNLYGVLTGAKRDAATFNGTLGYELLPDAATGTIQVGISRTVDPTTTNTANLTQCTATFKLAAGYAFDMPPPAGAKCPANALTVKLGKRSFCKFCAANEYKKASTGQCTSCPAGSYLGQAGSTSCKACPAGSYCNYSALSPTKCYAGSYSPKAGAAECTECPANTFSANAGAISCSACPKFTVAPKGSSICSVPFAK